VARRELERTLSVPGVAFAGARRLRLAHKLRQALPVPSNAGAGEYEYEDKDDHDHDHRGTTDGVVVGGAGSGGRRLAKTKSKTQASGQMSWSKASSGDVGTADADPAQRIYRQALLLRD